MKRIAIGITMLLGFQLCTSELNEIDGVIKDHIDVGIGNEGNAIKVPTESFLGQYFSSNTGEYPISSRIENRVRHDFNSPVKNDVIANELSAKWTGDFYFESGEYNFNVTSDKGIKLSIDNQVILNDVDNSGATDYNINHQMDGVHRIVVEYNLESEDQTESVNVETSPNTSGTTTPPDAVETTTTDPVDTNTPTDPVDTNTPTDPVDTNTPTDPVETTPTDPVDTTPTDPVDTTPNDPIVATDNDTPTVEVEWAITEPEPAANLWMHPSMNLNPMGWAANTTAGQGGEVIRVTNLNKSGTGSFKEAIDYPKPRIIVFEVGGLIDLEGEAIKIGNPYVTIMGQTAPDPGITIIKGGLYIYTHDVIVQHIRIRPGENNQEKESGWEVDALNVTSGYNVIVDHCSFSWGTDENISASGPRFEGSSLTDWRKNTSHTITFSNNIIAECLNNSTHSKGSHSMGTLFHDNVTEVALIGNIYASNGDRNPLFKGGTTGVIVNNYIYNAKNFAIQYKISSVEWNGREVVSGLLRIIGNVVEKGPDSRPDLPFSYFGDGPVSVYWEDNTVVGSPIPEERLLLGKPTIVDAFPVWPELIEVIPSEKVKNHLLDNAGARPWARDEVDIRIVKEIGEGNNRIINSENDVGGYPNSQSSYRTFNPTLWNLN